MDNYQSLSKKMKPLQNPSVWFLVQRILPDETAAEYFNVVSDVLIIDEMSNTFYLPNTIAGRTVRFIHEGLVTEGKVIYSADSKAAVMKFYCESLCLSPMKVPQEPKSKYFLIQYSIEPKTLIHSIVAEKDISRTTPIQSYENEILVYQNGRKRLANILYVHEDKDFIEQESKKLRQFCYDNGADQNGQNSPIGDNDWIFILYTTESGSTVYAIMNNNMTYFPKENPYRDVLTYLINKNDVYQAIIIRNSSNIEELTDQLNIVATACLTLNFPLEIDLYRDFAVPPPDFDSFLGPLEIFQSTYHDETINKLFPEILKQEQTAKEQADFIAKILMKAKSSLRLNLQRFRIINEAVPDLVRRLAPGLERKFNDLQNL